MTKPKLGIFCSRKQIDLAGGIQSNLHNEFEITPWTQGFFRSNEVNLTTFLKRIIILDAAVVILGDDDLRFSQSEPNETVYVPRDNVIFEMGALMERLGIRKTFVVVPESPKVVLPSYLSGFEPLKYETRQDNNYVAGTGVASLEIKRMFSELEEIGFYSDLPAVGLAFGYFSNFVHPVYVRLSQGGDLLKNGGTEFSWQKTDDFRLNIVIPEDFVGRDKVNQVYNKAGLTKIDLDLDRGRNISVHAFRGKFKERSLDIYDMPTTLLTCNKVIDMIDQFWGKGDRQFKDSLRKREVQSFERSLRDRIKEADIAEGVRLIPYTEFQSEFGLPKWDDFFPK